MQVDLEPARALHSAGIKLVALVKNTKQPAGKNWNKHHVTEIDDDASGFGIPLAANDIVSIDPDDIVAAMAGMAACGFDLESLMKAGVRTVSTRPCSGGRSTFRDPGNLKWLKFRVKGRGIVLELRATSPNLQDVCPGLIYTDKQGEICTQSYTNCLTHADCADLDIALPADALMWWARMSADPVYFLEQQRIFAQGCGGEVVLDYSTHRELPFASPHRGPYNRAHGSVEAMVERLERHGYTCEDGSRWLAPDATGQAGLRFVEGSDNLWHSSHGSDPLSGNFDAWQAHVILEHEGDVSGAERAWEAQTRVAVTSMFTALPPLPTPDVMPAVGLFKRNPKTGVATATLDNIALGLSSSLACGFKVREDRFTGEVMVCPHGETEWRVVTNGDIVIMRANIERTCKMLPVGREIMRDALDRHVAKHHFDSAIDWIKTLVWDGTPRVERFLSTHFACADTEYSRALSMYIWSGLAARCLVPGYKIDIAPIFVGGQGIGKSTGLMAMSPFERGYAEVDLGQRDSDAARLIRGVLVGEMSELRGLATRDLESVKAFLVRQREEWIPKFREMKTTAERRLMFFGTSNQFEFLSDSSGERRFAPIEVGADGRDVDREAITRDCEQLWAEGAELFKAHGVLWQDAQRLAASEHEKFKVRDAWEQDVKEWLEMINPLLGFAPGKMPFTSGDVLKGALQIVNKDMSRAHQMRVGSVLKGLGYEKFQRRIGGQKGYFWSPIGVDDLV